MRHLSPDRSTNSLQFWKTVIQRELPLSDAKHFQTTNFSVGGKCFSAPDVMDLYMDVCAVVSELC